MITLNTINNNKRADIKLYEDLKMEENHLKNVSRKIKIDILHLSHTNKSSQITSMDGC